jgi:hypothetical protein
MAMWPQGSDNTGKAARMHVEGVRGGITAGSVEAIATPHPLAPAYVSALGEAAER